MPFSFPNIINNAKRWCHDVAPIENKIPVRTNISWLFSGFCLCNVSEWMEHRAFFTTNRWHVQGFLRIYFRFSWICTISIHKFSLYTEKLVLGTCGAVFCEHYSINKIHLLNIILGGLNIFFCIMFVLQFLRFQASYKYTNIHSRFTTINKIRSSLYP